MRDVMFVYLIHFAIQYGWIVVIWFAVIEFWIIWGKINAWDNDRLICGSFVYFEWIHSYTTTSLWKKQNKNKTQRCLIEHSQFLSFFLFLSISITPNTHIFAHIYCVCNQLTKFHFHLKYQQITTIKTNSRLTLIEA